MTVSTFTPHNGYYSGFNNVVVATGSNYALARAGSQSRDAYVQYNDKPGQERYTNYEFWESFLRFDTSSIPDDHVVTGISLELWFRFNNLTSTSAWDVEVREHVGGWGTGNLVASNWVPGDSLASHPLLGLKPAADFGPVSQYYAIPFTNLDLAGLGTGYVYMFLSSSRLRTGDAPAVNDTAEIVAFQHEDTHAPRLVVTHDVYVPPPVEEVASTLPLTIGLSGALTDVEVVAPVEELTTSLGITLSLEGELTDVGPVEDVGTSLPLTINLSGSLTTPGLTVNALQTSLGVTVDLDGVLKTATPALTTSLALVLDFDGTLTAVTEVVREVQGSLAVIIDLDGTLSLPPQYAHPRPQSRSVSVPYKRTSVSRVYKNQFRSRRW